MKRAWFFLTLLTMILCRGMPVVASDISIYIDGQKISTDVLPEVHENTIFVPVRMVSEQLGAKVDYYGDGSIWISNFDNNGSIIMLAIGLNEVGVSTPYHLEGNVNDAEIKKFLALPENKDLAEDIKRLGTDDFGGDFVRETFFKLSVAPYSKNGTTMVPLRFVSEQLGCEVIYKNGRIDIYESNKILLFGQEIFSLQISSADRNDVIKQNNIISLCTSLIEKSRGANIEQPQSVLPLSYQGFLFSFFDNVGQVVSAWQFFVPESENDKISGWSSIYLYDSINDIWYIANPNIYEEYFYGDYNLEAYLNSH